jgi:hypothetical protein
VAATKADVAAKPVANQKRFTSKFRKKCAFIIESDARKAQVLQKTECPRWSPPGRMVSIRRHFLIPWLGAGPGQADAHAFTLSAPAAG